MQPTSLPPPYPTQDAVADLPSAHFVGVLQRVRQRLAPLLLPPRFDSPRDIRWHSASDAAAEPVWDVEAAAEAGVTPGRDGHYIAFSGGARAGGQLASQTLVQSAVPDIGAVGPCMVTRKAQRAWLFSVGEPRSLHAQLHCSLRLLLPSSLPCFSARHWRPGSLRGCQPLPAHCVGVAAAPAGEMSAAWRLGWPALACLCCLLVPARPPASSRQPSGRPRKHSLPPPPRPSVQPGRVWERVVDTSLQPPDDALLEGGAPVR